MKAEACQRPSEDSNNGRFKLNWDRVEGEDGTTTVFSDLVILRLAPDLGATWNRPKTATWRDLWRDNSGAELCLILGPMEVRNNGCVLMEEEYGARYESSLGPSQDRGDAEDLVKQSWCQMRGGVGTKTRQNQI
ncbi:trk active potasium channel [Corchorus olitorius]|uniref:Trk active potasium channel n=1 Tax=Corchorus olitorius TaxID=93759 RepID=A0A1R3J0C1_9ROSI|nr:trk active potasium channel [Corchorus olitorius]